MRACTTLTKLAKAEQRLGTAAEETEIAVELDTPVEQVPHQTERRGAFNIGELEFLRDENETATLLKHVSTPDEDPPAIQLEKVEAERLMPQPSTGFRLRNERF
jgi:hypothetical protein